MEENEQLTGLINKDLGGLNKGLVIANGISDRQAIREQLAFVIARLMEENFERLCQAMYRLDISEVKFDEVLTQKPVEEIPYAIADLVIEREMQKVMTRMMYKRGEL
jgi:hypothetical protein